MKIIHVLTRLLKAGSEENTMISCRGQCAQGDEVTLIYGEEFDPDVLKLAAEAATHVHHLPSMVHRISIPDDIKAVRELVAYFKQHKPDVVHTHQSKAGILGRIAAKLAGVPCIVHGVHILPFENVSALQSLIYTSAEWFCGTFTDAFISVSPALMQAYLDRKIGAPETHSVAYSAMDVAKFQGATIPSDWRELLGVSRDADKPPTLVMLSAFEPRKRHLDLIAALSQTFKALPDWRVIFAGVGELENAAKAEVARLGLSDKIRFAGYRRDPEAIIALADLCILVSMREGLPRVVVQYVAAGKPTIVADLPGIEVLVHDGVNGIITPSNDVNKAAQEAARLLADQAELARLAQGTKEIDVSLWSSAAMIAAINAAYAKAMNTGNVSA